MLPLTRAVAQIAGRVALGSGCAFNLHQSCARSLRETDIRIDASHDDVIRVTMKSPRAGRVCSATPGACDGGGMKRQAVDLGLGPDGLIGLLAVPVHPARGSADLLDPVRHAQPKAAIMVACINVSNFSPP